MRVVTVALTAEQRSRGRGWIHPRRWVGLGVGMGRFRDQGVETGRFRLM